MGQQIIHWFKHKDVLSTTPYKLSSESHCSVQSQSWQSAYHSCSYALSSQHCPHMITKWRTDKNVNRAKHILCCTTTMYSTVVRKFPEFKNILFSFLDPNVHYWKNRKENLEKSQLLLVLPPPHSPSILQSGPLHPITANPKPHPRWHHDWKSWPECLKSGSDRRRYLPTLRSAESTGCMREMERRKYYSQNPASLYVYN